MVYKQILPKWVVKIQLGNYGLKDGVVKMGYENITWQLWFSS